MKFRLSLPTNQSKFNDYAKVYKIFKSSSYICQLISFATGIGIVGSYFYGKFTQYLPEHLALGLTIALAIITTGAIEALSRVCLEEGIIAIYRKRIKGLDLLMTIFLLSAGILAVATSGFISFKGGKEVGHTIVGDYQEKTTNQIDSIHQYQTLTLNTQYRKDSAAIANNYNTQIAAIPAQYANQINTAASKHQSQINQINTKLQKADPVENKDWIKKLKDQRYTLQQSQKAAKQAVINQRESAKSQLQTQKAQKLFDLLEEKKLAINTKNADHTRQTNNITTDNQNAKQTHETKKAGLGLGIGWFTLAILTLFIICIIAVKTIEHLTGMTQEATVNAYYFMPTIWAEFKEMVSKWYQWICRTLIHLLSNKKQPPIPHQETLYQYNALPNIVKINYQNTAQEITIPQNQLQLIAASLNQPSTGKPCAYPENHGFNANPEKRPEGFEEFDQNMIKNQKSNQLDGQPTIPKKNSLEHYNWLCLNVRKYTKRVEETQSRIPQVASDPDKLKKSLQALQNRQTKLAEYQLLKKQIAQQLGFKE